jgi:hypothetical protein
VFGNFEKPFVVKGLSPSKLQNVPIIIRLVIAKSQDIYPAILQTLSSPRRVSQLLFCKQTTTKYEIETFMLRALLDPQSRTYILVELSRLPARIQVHL